MPKKNLITPHTSQIIFVELKSLLQNEKPSPENYKRAHKLLLEIYKHRCALCGGYASSIHEIEPRSTGLKAWKLDNMIPVCVYHHDQAHRADMSIVFKFALNHIMRLYFGDHLE